MIEFIRSEHCTECDVVQAQLEEMVVAHTVTVVAGATDDVPMIKDGDFVDEWSHFQSDTCYVDAGGGIC